VDASSFSLRLADGRSLDVAVSGRDDATPLVFHHGTPSGSLQYRPFARAAVACGLRLVSYSRPGYASSTRQPDRDVAGCAADVAAILDHLGADRCYTAGASGGGPHALACAALLPDRVYAAAALASPAPYDAEGLEWLAGGGELNVVEFNAALQGETAVRPLLEQWHGAMNAGGAEGMRDEMASLLGAADLAALAGGLAEYLHEGVVETGGVDGWLDDDLAFVSPWGFGLETIAIPVLIRHGEQDRFVAADHSRWLGAHIPGAEVRITANDGHLTLYEHAIPEIQAWLLGHRSDGSRS
jgi:pimeloyl-ACP methyl ester carboxylesterase